MNRTHIRETVAIAGMLICTAAVIGQCLTGCSAPMTPQEKAQVANETYAAEQVACVEKSATIVESRACRAEVRARWGVDGGWR